MKVSQARWLALAGLLALSLGSDCSGFDSEGYVCTTTHEGEKVCDEHSGSEMVIICSADQKWEEYENCLESNQVCVEIEGVVGEAECVDPTCSEGETRCSDDRSEVETCNAQGIWAVTETCVQGCEVVNDEAQCVSDDDSCTANNLFDQRCNPFNEIWIQECQNTGTEQAPVYEWVDSQDCSLQSPDYICIQEMGTFPYCFL